MSIDVATTGAASQAAAEPPHRTRRVVLAVVLALLLAVLASCLAYRQTVTSERDTTFRSVWQAQTRTAYAEMAKVGWKQIPADASAMSDRMELELTYYSPDRRITVDTPAMRLGREMQLMRLDAEMVNYDLPSWVGGRYDFISLLLYGTYINDENGSSSDEGSCVIRLGDPYGPVLTEEVLLDGGYLAAPCTPAQLASIGEA